uniref:Uncharacterized protein n=1 Tax=Cajanus cajan TaxID=3821 RepID=A0A151U7Q8_CAJCA|nr:hypothetical protein KK1_008082 [Cajanus cajan]
MEALSDPNIHIIGVCLCGNNDDHLNTVIRRVRREGLLGVTVMVNIGENPNLRMIQDEIAHQLGFTFQTKPEAISCCAVFDIKTKNKKVVSQNARELSHRIRTESNVLFILRDLHTRLDLAKLGVDHQFCKLVLTSHNEKMLLKRNNVQRTFKL